MISLHLKKGFSPKIVGAPSRQVRQSPPPSSVAMLPEHIPFIKPRMLVELGDTVAIGTPLFEDKRNPRIRFLSPGGGRISDIVFGPRRVIEKIIIQLDATERRETFETPSVKKLDATDRKVLVETILTGGMWPFIRALPFLDTADPEVIPPAIIVRLGDDEPFGPDPRVYLNEKEAMFEIGIHVLERLCDHVKVHILGGESIRALLPGRVEVRRFSGPYPAGNPCVQLYWTKKGPDQNRTWFIDGQDVVRLGEFFDSGHYPIERIVSVGGSLAPDVGHVSTRAGVPLGHLVGENQVLASTARYIVGGVFTGFRSDTNGFMGFFEDALNLIDDGDREEPFGFIRLGYHKPSYSTAFLSSLRRNPFPMDCGQHGELRACVNCGTCAKICPVEILPQFTMKCLVADEVEEALAHGLLDCAECGLCTYACPSKIELTQLFRSAKTQYHKEIA